MRVPRFRTRTMMVGVAIAACTFLLITRVPELAVLILLGTVTLLPVCFVGLPVLIVSRYYSERQWFAPNFEPRVVCSEGKRGARDPRRKRSKPIMILAVLCVVSTLGAGILSAAMLSLERQQVAEGHWFVVQMLEEWPECGVLRPLHTLSEPMWATSRGGRLAAYHRTMAAKYERAARYPWLPVEPDAPAPE